MKSLPVFCLFLMTLTTLLHAQTYSSEGKEFWALTLYNSNNYGFQDFLISAKRNCTVTFENKNFGYKKVVNVTGGTVYRDTINEWDYYLTAYDNETVSKSGLKITSTDTISLVIINFGGWSSDASNILPYQALGTRYRISSYVPFLESSFCILATEDSTEVEITPTNKTKKNRPANTPFTIWLNAGQSYRVAATKDLSGSLVRVKNSSCKKVAVFSGSDASSVPISYSFCGSGDALYEQMLPVEVWGNTFFTANARHRQFDLIRVFSDSNNNILNINGINVDTLNSGEFHDWYDSSSSYIVTSKKSMVVGYHTGWICAYNDSFGDPSMFIVNSTNQFIRKAYLKAVVNNGIDSHFLNLYCLTRDTGKLLINGNKLSPNNYIVSQANSYYAYARIVMNNSPYLIICPNGFSALEYGFGKFNSYAFSAGNSINGLTPVMTVNQNSKGVSDTMNVCYNDSVRMRVSSNVTYIRYEYDFGNGKKGYTKDTTFFYSSPGTYKVRLICTRDKKCLILKDTFFYFISVKNRIQALPISDTTICKGDSVKITIRAKDGIAQNYKYNLFGIGFVSSFIVNPDTTRIYKYIVTDGCKIGKDSGTFKIKVLDPLQIIVPKDTTVCLGNGVLYNLNGLGGNIKTYHFKWLNFNDTGRIKLRHSDTQVLYKVVLSDGCTNIPDTGSFSVKLRLPLKVSVNQDTIVCMGANVQLVAMGEGGDSTKYSFIWDNGLGSGNLKTITPMKNTKVRVILTDNCTVLSDTAFVNINIKSRLELKTSPDTIICLGGTAELKVNGRGGSGSYTYRWINENSTDSLRYVNPKVSNTYSVVIDDNCSRPLDTVAIYVKVHDRLRVKTFSDTTLCYGMGTFIKAIGTGGDTGNYQFNWLNLGIGEEKFIIPDSSINFYKVILSDGCSVDNDTGLVTVKRYDLLKLHLKINGLIFCKGLSAKMSVWGEGGDSSKYLFSWSDNLGFGKEKTVTPPNTTTYRVKLSDGCSINSDSLDVKVRVRSPLDVIGWADTTICLGQNFILAPIDTGGLPQNHKFIWDHGLGSGAQKNVSPDTTTTYRVILTDGCTTNPDTAFATVYVREGLILKGSNDTLICVGQSIQLRLKGSGGDSLNYVYRWKYANQVGDTLTVKPETSTEYYAELTDNCTKEKDSILIKVQVRDKLKILVPRDTIICYGDTLFAKVSAIGGDSTNYQFVWDKLGNGEDKILTPKDSVKYKVNLSDNCTLNQDSASFIVKVRDPLQILGPEDTTICYGQTINIGLLGKGGISSDYLFRWNNGLSTGPIKAIQPKDTIKYSVILSDGCTDKPDTIEFKVNVIPNLEVQFIQPTKVCIGDSLKLNVNGTGGIPQNYSFYWLNNGISGSSNLFKVYKDTSFWVTLTDFCSDSAVGEIKVNTFDPVSPDFSVSDTFICINQKISFNNLTKGDTIKDYQWDLDDNLMSFVKSPIAKYINPGNKTIRLVTTSIHGCRDTIVKSKFLTVKEQPVSIFHLLSSVLSISNPEIELFNKSLFSTKFEWDFGDGGGRDFQFEPQKVYNDTGHYRLMLIAKDDFGCKDTSYSYLQVLLPTNLFIPSSFSPNGDGLNDFFEVKGIGVLEIHLEIFNRWGEIIFSENSDKWDGRVSGYDEICMQGIYGYLIKISDYTGKSYYYRGTLTLLR